MVSDGGGRSPPARSGEGIIGFCLLERPPIRRGDPEGYDGALRGVVEVPMNRLSEWG
jgi:hypothetical protein